MVESRAGIRDALAVWHENDKPTVKELLEDLPYALQGLETRYFLLKDSKFEIQGTVSLAEIAMLRRLLEPGLLYRWLKEELSKNADGLIRQALYKCVGDELQNYLILVGEVDKRIRAQLEDMNLTTCIILMRDATIGLRFLYSLVRDTLESRGDEVLSAVFNYTRHGDKFVAMFSQRLFKSVSVPFYATLNDWVTSGTLQDPFKEFFVEKVDSGHVWEGQFVFHQDRVPKSISIDNAKKSFEIGKALYFLRVLCDDRDFVIERSSLDSIKKDPTSLPKIIDDYYQHVINHVNDLLNDKFLLHRHLAGLREFLLLTKGDFVESLLRESKQALERRAEELYHHELMSIMDAAISNSNATFEDDVILECLDAQILDLGPHEIGWQVFTLVYRLQSPLDVIIDTQASLQYRQIFNLLWRLRWASHALGDTWELLNRARRGHQAKVIAELSLGQHWRFCSEAVEAMRHFLDVLQIYIYTEVIDGAWNTMNSSLNGAPRTVDEIIAIHREYLITIKNKVLFSGSGITIRLHGLVDRILTFTKMAADLNYMVVHEQVERDPDGFSRLYKGIEQLRASFSQDVRKLLEEVDEHDENRSFISRLNYNYHYNANE